MKTQNQGRVIIKQPLTRVPHRLGRAMLTLVATEKLRRVKQLTMNNV